MNLRTTKIPGCFELDFGPRSDSRGRFVKTFHADEFRAKGLETGFVEQYYSSSEPGVLRGLHFQLPPDDHAKVVYAVAGEVFDVVVDLRTDSPAYREFETFPLSAEKGNGVYIPRGVAHGFCVLGDSAATLVYNVTSVYSPKNDSGIRWDTAGISWPIAKPLTSDRDKSFVALTDFASPFRCNR